MITQHRALPRRRTATAAPRPASGSVPAGVLAHAAHRSVVTFGQEDLASIALPLDGGRWWITNGDGGTVLTGANVARSGVLHLYRAAA